MEIYLGPPLSLADYLARSFQTVVEEPGHGLALGYVVAWTAALVGTVAAWLLYMRWFPAHAGQPLPGPITRVWRWARAKFYVDEVYDALIVRPVVAISQGLYRFVDELLIDSVAVGGTAGFFRRLGSWLRYTQSGNAQSYATVMAVGLLLSIAAVLTWVLR